VHEPLSQKLAQILVTNSVGGRITINHLLERTEGRGLYLVVMLLSLPFIVPVSIPGVSTVLGLIIALLCFRLALGLPPRLPDFLGERPLPQQMEKKIIAGSVKFLRFVEKLVKPRRTQWMSSRAAVSVNALLMTLMGLLLALPFPPLPPLTNALPCYSLILLAASMMEEDGVLIWFAYVMTIGTSIYLFIIMSVLEHAAVKFYRLIEHWVQK
jgi:hypothetical protein